MPTPDQALRTGAARIGSGDLSQRISVKTGDELEALAELSQALAVARVRFGARAAEVDWIVADVTAWRPAQTYDLWHDRAAFHFLTDAGDRKAYARCVRQAVRSGGHVIIGTFALDGPERCSGLPVVRHDAASIGAVLGASFEFAETRGHDHRTPSGSVQRFQFSRFRRIG